MKKREPTLLNNSLFLAAVFLDANNVELLSPEQKIVATEAVEELVLRFKGLKNDVNDSDNILLDSPTMASPSNNMDSDEELEQLIRRASHDAEDLEAETLLSQPSLSASFSSQDRVKRRKEMSLQVSWFHT
jgi:hypothetical protein